MTQYLAIALLITGFLVGDAYGEEDVYYCAEIGANGFLYDKELKKYARAPLTTEYKQNWYLDAGCKKLSNNIFVYVKKTFPEDIQVSTNKQ